MARPLSAKGVSQAAIILHHAPAHNYRLPTTRKGSRPMPRNMSRNMLAQATSPYLLQHKDNPVHWQLWGPDALAAAKAQGKPILLSVGYAACHWCHVMAHESFEDEAVAEVMNRHFINIKVDREERPDIDTIYMSALQLLGEHGGWPLTMFLTPEGEPFWGGTYFPKEPAYGRPGFITVLETISRLFHREPEKVEQNRAALKRALTEQSNAGTQGEPQPQILDLAAERLLTLCDPDHGGLRGAPKFPQTPLLTLLWRAHLRTGREGEKQAVLRALDHICEGGIYDHLGGGFARYSVDERWLAPHFEKMLYDNAMLIELLSSVWLETRKPLYAQRVTQTIQWLTREMRLPQGGFAASLDADSEGEEGRFYVWSEAEIDAALAHEAPFFKQMYNVSAGGNWEGKNILNRLHHADDEVSAEEESRLAPLRDKLLDLRANRVRPGFDDKCLSDWNGLAIATLASAGMAFARTDWIALAQDAFRFIETHMVQDGRLYHAWREGQLAHRAMSDGLANLARAALLLGEATGDTAYVTRAQNFVAELDAHYWSEEQGGYYFTADDAEALIIRTRSVGDSAVPAANGVMPGVLTRLALLTGKSDYLARADALIRTFAGELTRNIFPLGTYLASFETRLWPIQIVLIGDKAEALRKTVLDIALPTRLLMSLKEGEPLPQGHPASGKSMLEGAPTAYICRGETCSLPITEAAALREALLHARFF